MKRVRLLVRMMDVDVHEGILGLCSRLFDMRLLSILPNSLSVTIRLFSMIFAAEMMALCQMGTFYYYNI